VYPQYRLSGNGTIASGGSAFSGSLTGSNIDLTGSYAGGFFGPAAEEAGFTFALSGTTSDGRDQRIVGAAGGKR
jgi:hypothetical protein